MDKPPVDDRSPMAKSLSKVSEIIAICLLMIIPALIGYFIDQKTGTRFLLTLVGLLIGMVGAVLQLMKLVSAVSNQPNHFSGGQGDKDTDENPKA